MEIIKTGTTPTPRLNDPSAGVGGSSNTCNNKTTCLIKTVVCQFLNFGN